MLGAFTGPRLLSRPVQIRWAGFETNTYILQKEGWELSAAQDIIHSTMTIAGFHPQTRSKFITEVGRFDYLQAAGGYPLPSFNTRVGGEVYIVDYGDRFEDAQGSHYRKAVYPPLASSYRDFQPIDAMIQVVDIYPKNITDLIHFAPRMPKLILPEDTVGDLLDRIQKLQKPARLEDLQGRVLKQTIGIV